VIKGAWESGPTPDYFEPVIGWRSWAVIRSGADFRLRSIAFTDVWPVGEAFVAKCYEEVSRFPLRLWPRLPRHVPVTFDCDCGIHAAADVVAAAAYLHLYEDVPQRSICHRALGRVALWGTVVEGDLGWRASRAYPQQIFLPGIGAKRRVGLEAIIAGLSVYGVPIEVFDGAGRSFAHQVPEPISRLEALDQLS
jgi:hypothetical protein